MVPQLDKDARTPSRSASTRPPTKTHTQNLIASYFRVLPASMAPGTRSSSKKRRRSSSSRRLSRSSSSSVTSDSSKPAPNKKRRTSHSATQVVSLPARAKNPALKPRERAKSSTITGSEEPKSSDAVAPTSRTSSSIGFHEETDDSDESFDASEFADEQSADSDINSEMRDTPISERALIGSPTPPPQERAAASVSSRPRAAMKSNHQVKKQTTIGGADRDDAGPVLVRNKDNWKYKSGIKTEYPPIHDIEEIFDDMVQNAKKHTSIDSAIKHMADHRKSQKLRVATMCSGTESPILALDLIASAKHNQTLEMEHVFSAEIVPFKQAYIERNFSPPIIFRDIRDFVWRKGDNNDLLYRQKKASTAYGSSVDIPKDVDLLVAGFSCVDYSALNFVRATDLNKPGESGDTFLGVLQYADVFRPAMVLLENVYGAPWPLMKAAWEAKRYSAEFVKLDTKDYYIPHTRQRGYMLCINNEESKSQPGKSVQEWKDLMGKLERPASSSIEAFLLPNDDSRVHRGRAELIKGLKGEEKPPREVSWTKSQGRHLDYRSDLALGNNRPMTAWEDNGSCQMPDYAWGDWGRSQVERIWDTLEINKLRSARRGFDSEYKTRVWDLSQNIDRFTDTTPFGITSCVTPSGLPYVTSRGGPMTGLEALAMQGLPIEKLLLTRETQKQLQDLAGNAMTTTVVGSALLAALIAGHKSLKPRPQAISPDNRSMRSIDVPCDETQLKTHPLDISEVSSTPVSEVIASAKRSSRLCLCEGPSNITRTPLQRCEDCSHTTCVKCGVNPKHRYVAILEDETKRRLMPSVFEDELKSALPMRVAVTGFTADTFRELLESQFRESSHGRWSKKIDMSTWALFLSTITRALGEELRFHSLVRAETWTAHYESPTSRLELEITPYQAEWRLFAKPERCKLAEYFKPEDRKLQQLLSQPFARMRPGQEDLLHGMWQIRLPLRYQFTTIVEGKGTLVPAWESRLGLQGPKFKDKRTWSTLSVSVDPEDVLQLDEDISGEYRLLSDCGKASGSLHKRMDPVTVVPVFLFLDPTRLGDPELDQFVFSTNIRRLEFGQTRYVISQAAPKWRLSSVEGPKSVECVVDGQWIRYSEVALKPVLFAEESVYATPPVPYNVTFGWSTCGVTNAVLSCKIPVVESNDSRWGQGRWVTVNKVNERLFFASFAWLTEKVRKIPGLGDWKFLSMPSGYVRCQRCAPDPPLLKWRTQIKKPDSKKPAPKKPVPKKPVSKKPVSKKPVSKKDPQKAAPHEQESKLVPFEDPQRAAPYERALKDRPSAFVTQARVDEDGVQLLKIGLNVSSLIHRALSNLDVTETCAGVTLAWRLRTDYVTSPQPSSPRFMLSGNKEDSPANQPPSFLKELREEQLRSLSWMISQESDTIEPFDEEEVEEALLPQMGWLAEGSAKKKRVVRGGVLADEVGYGKTATTLGLIDSQRYDQSTVPDPCKCKPCKCKGKIHIKATLIVIPGHLVSQWESEINNFLQPGRYNVLKIKTEIGLSHRTIQDFLNADIILIPSNLLNGATYLANLAKFAAVPGMPTASGRAFNAWYAYALGRIGPHLDTLRSDGAKKLASTLDSSLAEGTLEDELNSSYVPSQRLRGKKYRDDVAARDAAAPIESAASESDILTEQTADNPSNTPKAAPDPFSLKSAKSEKDWTQVKRPLFQFFEFRRLVVDEYHYLTGANYTSVISLQAKMRWVLSGTPPLGDFADIKNIARFLKINLGKDDDSVGVTRSTNIKEMERERTDVEKFRSFQELHSPDWHQHRHEVAQHFLDRFARQNFAEIDAIPSEEFYHPYHLTSAERGLYLELHSLLMAQDMKIRKGRTGLNSDREKRMYQTLGESSSPEEALLKRCSHFELAMKNDRQKNDRQKDDQQKDGQQKNAIQACNHVVQDRKDQLRDLEKDLKKNLRHAVWLKAECGDQDKHYDGWKKNVSSNAFCDGEATHVLLEAIEFADKYKIGNYRKFYNPPQEAEKDETAEQSASDEAVSEKPKAKAGKPQEGHKGKKEKKSEDDIDFTSEEGSTKPEVKIQALRNLTDYLRRLSIELVSRKRSLRFFDAIREIQETSSNLAAGVGDTSRHTCCKCLKSTDLQDLSVLTICGHKACRDCLKLVAELGICLDSECKAAAGESSIAEATELGIQDAKDLNGGQHGKKLGEVIKLIKKIGKEEQVLLFVQFDDLLEKVASALRDQDISYSLVKKSDLKADKIIKDFQENTSADKKNVLILNMAKESASGANLTNANHVIFLSPVLTDDLYGYKSSRAQAIGRAKRCGQLKTVKIYHFLALNTIDIDVLQAREHKKLVQHKGQWKLVEKTSSLEINGTLFPANDLRDYGGRLAKNHWLFNEDFQA
ncbi:MAG: hypothetical protein M1812_000003 [Candelaria pacifica]|nr:MAG: hypothetical protein M1812_000003 [Candelaria pacifica]